MIGSYFGAFLIFLIGLGTGLIIAGAGVWYILSFFFHDPQQNENESSKKKRTTFQLPPILLSKINDESCKSEESCWAFNFVLYFLFRELHNSEAIRRWFLRKLTLEFDELLTTSVLGKFFSSINIQDLDLGENFPIVNWLKTTNVELHPVFKSISVIDMILDIDYTGGFKFSLKAETSLKHTAYLSIEIKSVKGQARVQFSTEPYAHWSFSFNENPDVDISVSSQVYGKSFNQITSIISSQLKRSVRKKHTLPMYKMRYKPFFTRFENIYGTHVSSLTPPVGNKGSLLITMIEGRGLMSTLLQGDLYAYISISDFNWTSCVMENNNDIFITRDAICLKTAKRETNLDFILRQQENTVIVDSITCTSSGKLDKLEFEPEDEIIAVDGKKVTTVKQCIKNFRKSQSLKVVWRIRRKFQLVAQEEKKELKHSTLEKIDNFTTSTKTVTATVTTATNQENVNENDSNTVVRRKSFSFVFSNSNNLQKIYRVIKSSELSVSKDPVFDESFNVEIDESSKFINLCLFSKYNPNTIVNESPSKKNKVIDKSDKLVGTISIPLVDVIAECCTTGIGKFEKDIYLSSPDGNATEALEFDLKNYPGFEPHLCYGKLSLGFQYKSQENMPKENKEFSAIYDSFSMTASIETASEAINDESVLSEETLTHKFIRTHFRIATPCDYCNKKIWLKEAMICVECKMKCHKKCIERCLINTVCNPNSHNFETPEIHVGNDKETKVFSLQNLSLEDNGKNFEVKTDIKDENMRRKTLGGLIVSAVQNRSMAQLKRTGSGNQLFPPSNNTTTRSLPPSPQASPTTNRKISLTNSEAWQETTQINPFDLIDSNEEDYTIALDYLVNQPYDESLVSLAKESGRNVYKELSTLERKERLNEVINRLHKEIDTVSSERLSLDKEEVNASAELKNKISIKIEKCEKRVQALALLMLHFHVGLEGLDS